MEFRYLLKIPRLLVHSAEEIEPSPILEQCIAKARVEI